MNTNLTDSIVDRESFVRFVGNLSGQIRRKGRQDLADYLESLANWVEDMDGFYINTNRSIPSNVNWRVIGEMLTAATIYE